MRKDGTAKEQLTDDGVLFVNVVGEWVYFISRADNMMHKIQVDGTGRTMIDNQHAATVMVVVGDWIYYVTQSEQYRIYKIRTNGTEKTRLGEDYLVQEFYVVRDWIFYTSEALNLNIYRMKTNGSGRQRVTEDGARQLNVGGEWVYFVNQSMPGIYRVTWDGTNKTSFQAEYASPTALNIYGDMIYYGLLRLVQNTTYIPRTN